MNNTVELSLYREKRTAKQFYAKIETVHTLLPSVIAKGCQISRLFYIITSTYLKRVYRERLPPFSIQWKVDAIQQRLGTLLIRSNSVTMPGDILRIQRMQQPTRLPNELKRAQEAQRFIDAVSTRLDVGDEHTKLTLTALGTLLVDLLERRALIAEFIEDEGYHLYIPEHPDSDQYLYIYLGGCFRYPPAPKGALHA